MKSNISHYFWKLHSFKEDSLFMKKTKCKTTLKFNDNFLKSHVFEFENNGSEAKSLFKGDCKGCGKTLKFKVKDNILERQSITFTLNGQNYTGKTFSKKNIFLFNSDKRNFKIIKTQVENDYPLNMSLNTYLRDILHLIGFFFILSKKFNLT